MGQRRQDIEAPISGHDQRCDMAGDRFESRNTPTCPIHHSPQRRTPWPTGRGIALAKGSHFHSIEHLFDIRKRE